MSPNVNAIVTQINETHIKEKSFVYTWVVKNFNCFLPLKVQEYITSPDFRSEYGLYKLQLYLSKIRSSPGQVVTTDSRYMTLVIDIKTHQLGARSIMSLVNKTGKENFHYPTVIRQGCTTGTIMIVEKSKITHDFLPNDDLTIKWKLQYYIGEESFENLPLIQSMQNLLGTQRLAVLDDFEKLMKDNRYSDIKIIVGTQIFYAHKGILAARSRYFAAIFESNRKDVKEGEIRISAISANIMEEILRFIYTGKIKEEKTIITDVLIVADMYKLDGLIIICEEAIISNMSLNNIGSILTVIDRLSDVDKLKASAIEFLTRNAKELSKSELFRKMLNSLSPSFVVDIMNIMMSKI